MKPNFNSNIYAIQPRDGVCGICETTVKLTHADTVTPLCVGECCKIALWIADAFLEAAGRAAGICHLEK